VGPTAADPQAFLRDMAIAMAQYQGFVHTLAIRRHSRRQVHRWYWGLTRSFDCVSDLIKTIRGMRGHAPSSKTLNMIDLYLRFLAPDTKAAAFVYGHSHRPGKWLTPGDPRKGGRRVPVYNCGSFVPPRGMEASMLLLAPGQDGPVVDLISLSASGTETSVRLT
jgi:hypothetical protein